MARSLIELAREQTGGGLSHPTKMPESSYNLPPQNCLTGSVLAQIPGTVCSKCYGRKGRYLFPAVQNCLKARLGSLKNDQWVHWMGELIRAECSRFFRWHDVGDIQNMDHLKQIMDVVYNTDKIRHWLPTKEIHLLLEYVEWRIRTRRPDTPIFPPNLTIRVSSPFINTITVLPEVEGVTYAACFDKTSLISHDPSKTGMVFIGGLEDPVWLCPSKKQGNKCGNCRMCWSRKVSCVAYGLH